MARARIGDSRRPGKRAAGGCHGVGHRTVNYATGTILGILSGGTGNCTAGGTTYYQPIAEVLAAYGLTLP
ncbi:hypothetical protein [Micromonospora sp. CPCC 205558]|uniref:hypothetical protein n=1 Tax=Micromonospora sp. CPCC 205558 TaxID=3122403 RepID=UPI002FF05BFA